MQVEEYGLALWTAMSAWFADHTLLGIITIWEWHKFGKCYQCVFFIFAQRVVTGNDIGWLDWICLTATHVLQDIYAVLHK